MKDLLVRSRGVDAVGLRVVSGRLPYPSAVGSILGESTGLQSRVSLPTVTGLTVTSRSNAVADLHRFSVNVPSCSHEGALLDAVDLEDVSLAVLADQQRVRIVKG